MWVKNLRQYSTFYLQGLEIITEENLNEEAAKRYITTSLKREYASENGTELGDILPKMSPLNMGSLTAVSEHVKHVSDAFQKGFELQIKRGKTFTAKDIDRLQKEKNKFIGVLRQHCLSYLALWHLRAAIEDGKDTTNKSTSCDVKQRVFECAARLYHGWYQIVDGNEMMSYINTLIALVQKTR